MVLYEVLVYLWSSVLRSPPNTVQGSINSHIPSSRVSLLGVIRRWQSPTCAIRKSCINIYALVVGMSIPNTDDETGCEDEWCSIIKEYRKLLHYKLGV